MLDSYVCRTSSQTQRTGDQLLGVPQSVRFARDTDRTVTLRLMRLARNWTRCTDGDRARAPRSREALKRHDSRTQLRGCA